MTYGPIYPLEPELMRNTVKLIDPSIPDLTVFQLQPGEMFQFVNNVNDGVYMKLDGFGKGNAVVYLPTGMYYELSNEKKVRRVTHIQISSPI